MKPPTSQSSASKGSGSVRLIAGQWRGSRLPVAPVPGLRPTSDRVRETVFNWLQSDIAGARVLDLYAGSGALGFEAGSRGASQVDLVEAAPAAVAALRSNQQRLGGASLRIHAGDALSVLGGLSGPFDGVFLDPPFASSPWAALWPALLPKLAPTAWVYVETGLASAVTVPAALRLHREGSTREVRYALYRLTPP